MTHPSALLHELKQTRSFDRVLGAVPYAAFLGLSVELVEEDPITRLAASDTSIGNPTLPALHGGAVGALLESAAIFKLLWEIDNIAVPKTINITVDYLRSARVVDTYARASITKHGRRVVSVLVRAWQSDEARPVATAHAHFLLRTADTSAQ